MVKWDPEKETFPSNSVFGNWAWTYKDLDSANIKYLEIEARAESRLTK